MRHARRAAIGALLGSALMLAASVTAYADDSKITLGFSQVGAESAWRTANTVSVKSAAKDAGINLKFSDAQQKQENQRTGGHQQHGVDRRADDLLAYHLELRFVRRVAGERVGQIPGAFGCAHGGDIKRRKSKGLLLHSL